MSFRQLTSHRLTRNVGALGLMQLVNYIAPLFILLHLTSILSVDLYGVVAFSTGIVLLGFVAMDFGYSLSATNKVSLKRENKRFVSGLIGAILKVKCFIFIFLFLAILLFSYFSIKYAEHREIIILSAFPIFFQGMMPVWFFQGTENLKNVALYTIFAKALFLVLVLTFIRHESMYWLVPVFNGISQLGAFVLAFLFIYRLGYWVQFRGARMTRYALQINKGFFLSRVSVAIYMQAGSVLLGLVSGPAAVAIYNVAEQLYKVMQAAIAPIGQAIYPYMAKEKNFSLYRRISFSLIGCVVVAAVAGYVITPYLLPMLFGPKWVGSIPVLNVFFVAIVVHVCAVMAGYPICVALNILDVSNRSVVVGSVVYFVAFTISYHFGMVSPVHMAAMMILAECYVFLHRIWAVWFASRKLKVKEIM